MVSAEMNSPPPADPIGLYLAQLELALSGRNPALVHDALIDAESHLRAAVNAGSSPQQAVDDFGNPEDIARAYIEADHPRRGLPRDAIAADLGAAPQSEASAQSGGSVSDAGAASGTTSAVAISSALPPAESFWRRARRFPILGIWVNPYAWGSLVYFTTIGFAFSIFVFTWIVAMGSLSLGLMPVLVGILVLLLLLGSVRGLCLLDGILCQFFLGVRMPRRTQPVYTTSGISIWQRIGCWLRDVRSWLSLGYLLGSFPVMLVLFSVFIALIVSSAMLLGVPLAELVGGPMVVHADPDESCYINWFGTHIEPNANGELPLPWSMLLACFAGGVVLSTGTLWLARGIGWIYGHVVQAIQVARPRAVLVRPVQQTTS